MKSYTDIEQSKGLAEILPIESADMYYSKYNTICANTLYGSCDIQYFNIHEYIPCYSLATLLSVLPNYALQTNRDGTVFVVCESKKPMISDAYDNPIDACVEMILKLNEQKLI